MTNLIDIKKIIFFGGVLGPAMIVIVAIILLIVGVIWAAHHGQIF